MLQTALCAGCEEYHFLHDGMCMVQCPEEFYEDKEQGECLPCHSDCASCVGPKSNDCHSCMDPETTLHYGACLAVCPSHTYRDTTTGACNGTTKHVNHIDLKGKLLSFWVWQSRRCSISLEFSFPSLMQPFLSCWASFKHFSIIIFTLPQCVS